jgi:hypothetical protein
LKVSGCSACVESVLMDPFCREPAPIAQTGHGIGWAAPLLGRRGRVRADTGVGR